MHYLFDTLNTKFCLQHNKMIKSFQYCKLSRQSGENAEEWTGRLIITVSECCYKELDRQLKEQCIHTLNDNDVLPEIIHELTSIKDTSIVTSEQVLAWDR